MYVFLRQLIWSYHISTSSRRQPILVRRFTFQWNFNFVMHALIGIVFKNLYLWKTSKVLSLFREYIVLAVSTRPPAGDLSRCALYCLGSTGLCPPYLSRLALEFSRPMRASVRSFIGIRQVAPNDLEVKVKTLPKTLHGSTWVPMSSLVLIGPAVWPAITRIQTNKQTNKQINRHNAFLFGLANKTGSFKIQTGQLSDGSDTYSIHTVWVNNPEVFWHFYRATQSARYLL